MLCCRHASELGKWEALVAEAKQQQAAAAAASQDAQHAQQLAEASRAVLADLERALDAREAKLHDSWRALKSQLAGLNSGGSGSEAASPLLHLSDQRLRDDAQAAALEAAAGRAPSPLPSVNLSSAASADLVKVCV
jgi:hypothetical protein